MSSGSRCGGNHNPNCLPTAGSAFGFEAFQIDDHALVQQVYGGDLSRHDATWEQRAACSPEQYFIDLKSILGSSTCNLVVCTSRTGAVVAGGVFCRDGRLSSLSPLRPRLTTVYVRVEYLIIRLCAPGRGGMNRCCIWGRCWRRVRFIIIPLQSRIFGGSRSDFYSYRLIVDQSGHESSLPYGGHTSRGRTVDLSTNFFLRLSEARSPASQLPPVLWHDGRP